MRLNFKPVLSSLVLCACLPWLFASPGAAGDYLALEGVTAVKTIFDVRDGKPESALVHLQLLHDTYKDQAIRKASSRPDFVVVFMGPSVKLLSSNRESFSPEQRKTLEKVDLLLSAMAKDGIRLEMCLFAANFFHVDPKTVSSQLAPVGNGWISEIGYQAKGYSLVPIY